MLITAEKTQFTRFPVQYSYGNLTDLPISFIFCLEKFNKLLITEYVAVQAEFQLDPSNNFHDDLFHHAPYKVSLRYQGHDQRSCESTNHDDVMTEIPFYSPGEQFEGNLQLSIEINPRLK